MPKRALPSANDDDYQYWAEPILSEDTRARLEHFRQLGHLPPNYKPKTLQGIAVVEKYWRRYCDHMNEQYLEHLLLEDAAIYMSFFDWMWTSSRKKALQSYDEYWRRLNQYFSLFAHRSMNSHVHQQLRRFLNHKFPAERKISRRAKKKETLTVEEYGLFQQYHWKYSFYFRCGNMMVQQSSVMLWSSITGSRPGVLLPDAQLSDGSQVARSKRVRTSQKFLSDVPTHMSADDMPKTVCYEDIELFYLRNPTGGQDVLCAIITFRNLKGRPEGADGTRFFRHCDSLLPYCPILHIVTMALRDNAFQNDRITADVIWRLKVPKRLPDLPLRWKKEKLRQPLLRRMQQTPNGYEIHPSLPMAYDASSMCLKHIGEGLGYENMPTHYNFRRWAANEVNRSYVQSERMRILGQAGNSVFEKHYQRDFIGGLQEVVLLRPSQAALCNEARKKRNRDPLAPKDFSDEQLGLIRKDPRILKLRQERNNLKNEMRSLAGTVEAAKDSYPKLYREHELLCKRLGTARKELIRHAKDQMKMNYFDRMPVNEVDKQIDQLLLGVDIELHDFDQNEEDEEVLDPPTPEYAFEGRARIVDAFYGPQAESLDGEAALNRRIQVTKDMVALCEYCEPNRRGKTFDWNNTMDDGSDDEIVKPKTENGPDTTAHKCPRDVCIVCSRKFPRVDSLRRHLLDQHLGIITESSKLVCSWKPCDSDLSFTSVTLFLNHAATAHDYDINISHKQLDRTLRNKQDSRRFRAPTMQPLSRAQTESTVSSSASTLVSSPGCEGHVDQADAIDPCLLAF